MPTDALFDIGKFDDSLFDTYTIIIPDIVFPTSISVSFDHDWPIITDIKSQQNVASIANSIQNVASISKDEEKKASVSKDQQETCSVSVSE